MVVFDATILIPMLWPDCPPPRDPETNNPISDFRSRIEHLVSQLERRRTKIVIPTPALSEVLVRSPIAVRDEYLRILTSSRLFLPAPFDQRAALELAIIMSDGLRDQDKQNRTDETYAKFKFDRQIVAIARVENASTIYTDDKKMLSLCKRLGITAVTISELPLPPEDQQLTLDGWARDQNEQKDGDERPDISMEES